MIGRVQAGGDVAHSGTFTAPLTSILAGLAFVAEINRPEFWRTIESLAERLNSGLEEIAQSSPVLPWGDSGQGELVAQLYQFHRGTIVAQGSMINSTAED